MNYRERCLSFPCTGVTLVGVLAEPERPADLGVVVVVGGPQTRVGSHRQFVLLSRSLAEAGFATLRFDYRGMGDSTGDPQGFEGIDDDIGAAIDALIGHCPGIRRIVLWGLCDAASASLLYWQATRDRRLAGLCLLNPWARSESTLARTQIKHYYARRILQAEFWLKLLRGRLNPFRAIAGFFGRLRAASPNAAGDIRQMGFLQRMAFSLREFPGQILLVLSENDYTAKEFLEYATTAAECKGILGRPNIRRIDFAGADHTFSSAEWRDDVAVACGDWLASLAREGAA